MPGLKKTRMAKRSNIISKIERKGTQLSLTNGIILLVKRKTGSVSFIKALSIIFCLLPMIIVRINRPRIIHIKKDRV
jgi:hypothetical protein